MKMMSARIFSAGSYPGAAGSDVIRLIDAVAGDTESADQLARCGTGGSQGKKTTRLIRVGGFGVLCARVGDIGN